MLHGIDLLEDGYILKNINKNYVLLRISKYTMIHKETGEREAVIIILII